MISKHFQDIPLKRKFQLLILLCIFLLSITAFGSLQILSKAHEKALYQSVSSNLSYSARAVSEYLRLTDNLATSIFCDPLIQSHLPELQDPTTPLNVRQMYENSIYNVITNHLFNETNSHISYITIMQNENYSIHTYFPHMQNIPLEIRQDLIKIGVDNEGKSVWVTDYSQQYGLFLVKEIREAKDLSFRNLGVLVINIDLKTLISKSNTFDTDYDTLTWLLIDQDTLLYPTAEPEDVHIKALPKQLYNGYEIININGESAFAVKGKIPGFDWDYICAVSYHSIANTLTATFYLCIFALLFTIVLATIVSAQILNNMTNHIDMLIYKMHRFGNGHYKPIETNYDYSLRKDEIGQLHTNFDAMASKVDTLITENYTNELLKKEAQLKALESQMDPHFLYNTLDSINWRAKAIKADDIALITMSLGNLLRMSLGKTKTSFTIMQEMTIVENYIAIQKLRYPSRLDFSMDIPEHFWDYKIPKFTIQPLLENAIRYGLEEISEVCYISVTAFSENNKLIIEVKNNGSHFEDNLLPKLERQELQPHGFGIGLQNINKRLQISYGSKYGLKLYNIEDEFDGEEYAIVQIHLPLMKGDSCHV